MGSFLLEAERKLGPPAENTIGAFIYIHTLVDFVSPAVAGFPLQVSTHGMFLDLQNSD